MSVGVKVTVERISGDPASAARLAAALAPARLNTVIGGAAEVAIRGHFFALNGQRPNRLGGTRTQWWRRAGELTSHTVVEDGAVVSVAQRGVRLHLLGGEVRPGPGKEWVTIPAAAESHGLPPARFNDLRFVPLGPKLAALVRKDQGTAKGELPPVLYWLKRSVTRDPDATVLPSDETMSAAITRAADSFIRRRLAGPN